MNKSDYRFYKTLVKLLKPIVYLLYRPKFVGKENMDIAGPAIVASNHIHMCDPAFTIIATPRVIRYMSKKELNDSILGFVYSNMGTIRVDRQNDGHSSMIEAEKALNMGEVVGIFPEGTRNRNNPDKLLPFKFGAVKMAKETGSPIIPIALKGKGIPFFSSYRIAIGEPIYISSSADLEKENDKLRNTIQDLYDNL